MENITYCGIDFHKQTSTICMMDQKGQNVEKATVRSSNLVKFLANRKMLLIGIEASGGTNHMVDKLKLSGHDVRIINPNKQALVGYGGKKTDEKDAEAIANCLRLNFINEVHHKSKFAREIKSLIVSREMLVRTKVNQINHIRGILREFGIVMPKGIEHFMQLTPSSIEKVQFGPVQQNLKYLYEQILSLDEQVAEVEISLNVLLDKIEEAKLVRTIPGVGLMTACMLIAVGDDIGRFKDAKAFSSYLGLVPREHSSGSVRRLGSITRSGSEILRRYLIHGARSMIAIAARSKKYQADENLQWAVSLKKRIGMNKATVALAHRMARIAFAMMRDKTAYGQVRKNEPRPKITEFTSLG